MKFHGTRMMGLLAAATVGRRTVGVGAAFAPSTPTTGTTVTPTTLYGLFDRFTAGGSASPDDLDDQWEAQQEILRNRRKPQADRDAYFQRVEDRRKEASRKQNDLWAWQTKVYKKGEDPIDEWRKKRADGSISDLENQYGDEKKMGGIPIPMASFGVGGEFGVGGKFDNGGRFDLRLPYADQGYVDEDADVMGKLGTLFGGGGKQKKAEKPAAEPKQKKGMFPWDK